VYNDQKKSQFNSDASGIHGLLLQIKVTITRHFSMKNPTRVALLLIWLASCSQESVVTTQSNPSLQQNWDTFSLGGKPESVIETNYKQHVPDSLLDDLITKESFYFDEHGNLTSRETYGEKQLLEHKQVFAYDEKQNLVKITTSNSGGRTTNVQENILDSVGNAKQVKNFNNDGKLIYQMSYKYDAHRNPIEWKQEEPAIAVIYKRKYVYDQQGRCIEKEDATGGQLQVKLTINYDSLNTIETRRYVDGALESVTTERIDSKKQVVNERIQFKEHVQEKSYQYDDHHNITELIYRWDDEIDSIYSYRASYTYDQNGNWTKRLKSKLDGKPRTEVERKIEY
jgi:hypothetical protein